MGNQDRPHDTGLTDRDRFWLKVQRVGRCWEWQGSRTTRGYGVVTGGALAHRAAWMYTHGDIPEGLNVCHRCDNPPCVRPGHLYLGTQADNLADMTSKGRRKSNPPHGEDQTGSVLTPEVAEQIHQRYAQGARQLDLVQEFGVSKGTIHNVLHRQHWTTR
jgi:hypothetical protein